MIRIQWSGGYDSAVDRESTPHTENSSVVRSTSESTSIGSPAEYEIKVRTGARWVFIDSKRLRRGRKGDV